ncbi:MAG: DUF6770 family protein [Bacteroidota bacterium]
MMKNIFWIVLFVAGSFQLQAQKAKFEDVLSVQLQNMGPILENNLVKGYYMFYKVDKVDRKSNAYMLRILDANLKDVAKKKMINTKYTVMTEAVYNGEVFLFSFLDTRKKILTLQTYNREMKKLGNLTYQLDKWGMTQYVASGGSPGNTPEASNNRLIFPADKDGFIRYSMQKNKKVGYTIEYLPNDLKKTGSWKKSSPEGSKTMFMASHGLSDDKYVISTIISKPKYISNKDVNFELQMIEINSNKEVFRIPLKSSRYNYSFMNAFMENDEKSIIVFGEFYDSDENIFKGKSNGLYTMRLDLNGKVIDKVHHAWETKIKRKIKVNKKGRIEDGGYVAFHKIVQSSDGHFYAVGEMYNKAVSGLGVASQVLSAGRGRGGVSAMKMNVLNLIIFDFNADLTLDKVKVFEKQKRSIQLPQGYGIYPPTLLVHVIRAMGEFDYSFTQSKKDNSSFFTTYTSIEKKKGSKKKAYFGIISHTEGDEEYVEDKIDLTTDANNIMVLPAKPGYVLLVEYFKKKKQLTTRLEKINY